MIYFLAGGLVLAVLAWMRRSGPRLKHREWRLLSGGLALAAFVASAYVAIRGAWSPAVILFLLGLWLASITRGPTVSTQAPQPQSMAETQARQLLGVGPQAGRTEILAAYGRLIKLAHPDKGGTDGLAAQINAARDCLLSKLGPVG